MKNTPSGDIKNISFPNYSSNGFIANIWDGSTFPDIFHVNKANTQF